MNTVAHMAADSLPHEAVLYPSNEELESVEWLQPCLEETFYRQVDFLLQLE